MNSVRPEQAMGNKPAFCQPNNCFKQAIKLPQRFLYDVPALKCYLFAKQVISAGPSQFETGDFIIILVLIFVARTKAFRGRRSLRFP